MEMTFSLEEIDTAASKFLIYAAPAKLLCFYGEMGAGKTTFIQAYCRSLGVHAVMSSPTFSLINEYITKDKKLIYHMDLYRLKDAEEAINAGVEDYLYSGNLCLIEWPEIIETQLPENILKISLTLRPGNKRLLKII